MSKSLFITSVALVVSAICGSMLIAAESGSDDKPIRKAAKDFAEAYNQGNAEAVAAHWTKDGEYTIGQQTVKGRDKLTTLYAAFLKAHPGSKMDIKIDSIRFLAPTVAIEQGMASVSNSANSPASASTYSAVHVKQGDKWLMASVRESEMPTIQFDQDVKELDWMVGEWSAGKDATKVTMKCDWMTNKHFLRAEVTMRGKEGDLPGGTQIIGRNPVSGQVVSWFFSADGGYGTGTWQKDGSRWLIQTLGITADGTPTAATNMLYRADKNVASWQSFNRLRGNSPLPDVKEVVIERVQPHTSSP